MGKFRVKGHKSSAPTVRKIETVASVKSSEILAEVEKMLAAAPIPVKIIQENVIEKTEVVREVSKVDTRSRKYAKMLREKLERLDLRMMQDFKHHSVMVRDLNKMVSELKEENRKLRLETKTQMDELANRPVPAPQITEVHSTPKSLYYAIGACILLTMIALLK